MAAADHDRAVALVSHVPQVVASVVAARLTDAPSAALGLAGQGLRDMTRIAGSDPGLWTAILAANAEAVAEVLRDVRDDLDRVLGALETPLALSTIAGAIAQGNAGHGRVPGKHGGHQRSYTVLNVLVPDSPGSLARLLTQIGEIGVNLEDLAIEHAAGRPVGIANVSVLPEQADRLESELTAREWKVVR
jgi:prephenate dehydrogenase